MGVVSSNSVCLYVFDVKYNDKRSTNVKKIFYGQIYFQIHGNLLASGKCVSYRSSFLRVFHSPLSVWPHITGD